jgi:hypothetical protein
MSNPSEHPHGMQHANASGYEKQDASAKGIFLCVAGLFAALVLGDVAVHFGLRGLNNKPLPADDYSGSVRTQRAQTNYPPLQISPPTDLQQFRASEAEQLNNYGWVNRTGGVVRVPIERAMELVAERGLPARAKGQPGKAGLSDYELQLQRPNSLQRETGGSTK